MSGHLQNIDDWLTFRLQPSGTARQVRERVLFLMERVIFCLDNRNEDRADTYRNEAYDLLKTEMPKMNHDDFKYIYTTVRKSNLLRSTVTFYRGYISASGTHHLVEDILLTAAELNNTDLINDILKDKPVKSSRPDISKDVDPVHFDKNILYGLFMENDYHEAAQMIIDNNKAPSSATIKKYGFPKTTETEPINWQAQPSYQNIVDRFDLVYASTPRQEKNGTLELHSSSAEMKFIISKIGDIRKGRMGAGRVDLVKRTGLTAEQKGNQEKLLQEMLLFLIKREEKIAYETIAKNKKILQQHKIQIPPSAGITVHKVKQFWLDTTTNYPDITNSLINVPKEWMNSTVQNLVDLGFYDLL